VEYVRTVDLVELLFEVVDADYGAGSAGFFGSETAERNNILDSRISYCRRDRVADAVLKSAEVVAGIVGRNHDVGCVCLVEGFGQGGRVGGITDEYLRAFRRERLQMSRVSSDDTNFLPAGKKVLRHYVSSVAACSKNDVHIGLHSQIGCGGSGLDSRQKGECVLWLRGHFFGKSRLSRSPLPIPPRNPHRS